MLSCCTPIKYVRRVSATFPASPTCAPPPVCTVRNTVALFLSGKIVPDCAVARIATPCPGGETIAVAVANVAALSSAAAVTSLTEQPTQPGPMEVETLAPPPEMLSQKSWLDGPGFELGGV